MPDTHRTRFYLNTYLQSVLLNKSKYKTKKECIDYLKKHDYYDDGIDDTQFSNNAKYFHCRQVNPDSQHYYKTKVINDNVKFIIGYKKKNL